MCAMPANLNCILLNACGAAYNVEPGTNVYAPDTVYSPHVPYSQSPQVAYGGDGFLNIATVGQCEFGIVVAFRGTLPPSKTDPDSWLDWLQDFFEVPVSTPDGANHVPGQVHEGFYYATTSIIDQVRKLVGDCNPGPANPVFVTGHSKGGVLASIAAYILSQNLGVPDIQPVITFASPRPGDVTFQKGFESVLKQTRFENYRDIVPLVPPPMDFIGRVSALPGLTFTASGRKLSQLLERAKDWNYVPVGSMQFVTKDFKLISGESLLAQELDMAEEFIEDFAKRNFSSFGDAHSLRPGYGYNSGICGTSH